MNTNTRGQALVGVIISLIVLGILIPVVIRLTTRESVSSRDKLGGDTAYNLAQSGQMKAGLIISQNWDKIFSGSGAQISGFNFDTTYTDQASGSVNYMSGTNQTGRYSVYIASGPNTSEVTAIAIGQDLLRKHIRAIRAVYKPNMPAAPIFNPTAPTTGLIGYWGPVVRSVNQASGSVAIGTPAMPSLDFASYKLKAQSTAATELCTASGYPAGANPANTCYWTGSQTFDDLHPHSSSRTMFIDGDLTIATGHGHRFFLVGTLIVTGNLIVNSTGDFQCNNASYDFPDATSANPVEAWFSPLGMPFDAYNYPGPGVTDSAALNEWPGDNGDKSPWTATPANKFSFGAPYCGGACHASCESGNCGRRGTQDYPSFRGFIYVGGNAVFHSSMNMHGLLYVPNGTISIDPGMTVKSYYDPAAFDRIQSANPPPLQTKWSEVICDLVSPPSITGAINCH